MLPNRTTSYHTAGILAPRMARVKNIVLSTGCGVNPPSSRYDRHKKVLHNLKFKFCIATSILDNKDTQKKQSYKIFFVKVMLNDF